jgi:hypothetical protein
MANAMQSHGNGYATAVRCRVSILRSNAQADPMLLTKMCIRIAFCAYRLARLSAPAYGIGLPVADYRGAYYMRADAGTAVIQRGCRRAVSRQVSAGRYQPGGGSGSASGSGRRGRVGG